MLSTFEVSYQDGSRHLLHTTNSWDAETDEKLEYVKGLVSCHGHLKGSASETDKQLRRSRSTRSSLHHKTPKMGSSE